MKRNFWTATLSVLLVALFCATAISADEKTITGKINNDQQLVADDGTIYEVADSEKGDELIAITDNKVSVTGTVAEKEGQKTIDVTGFKVIE